MHPLYVQEKSTVDTIIQHYTKQLIFPVTVPKWVAVQAGTNWFEVFTKLMASLWAVFQSKGPPADVKSAITQAVLAFYRQAIEPLLQTRFGFLYRFLQGSVESIIAEAVSGVVDGLLKVAAAPTTTATPTLPTGGGGTTTNPPLSGGFIPY